MGKRRGPRTRWHLVVSVGGGGEHLGGGRKTRCVAPWQPREVAEEREGAHGLPPCFSGLAGLAHPSTRGDWKSLVTESFLVSCAPGQEPGSYYLWCHF